MRFQLAKPMRPPPVIDRIAYWTVVGWTAPAGRSAMGSSVASRPTDSSPTVARHPSITSRSQPSRIQSRNYFNFVFNDLLQLRTFVTPVGMALASLLVEQMLKRVLTQLF
jgi:hypothetical protein